MLFFSAFLCLFLAVSAFAAQGFERVAPHTPPPQTETHHEVLVKEIKAVVLLGPDQTISQRELHNARGIVIRGLRLTPKQRINLKHELKPDTIGRPLSRARIATIKEDIAEFFDDIGRPLVIVSVPEQDITDGTLVLVVTESKMGKLTVKGNKHFRASRYAGYMQMQEGDDILSDTLVSDVAWINRNNFRTANAVLKPGAEAGTTDIDLVVTDKRPFRIYVGTDNTGFPETGLERNFIGFNWGNLFGIDQTLSYQYTASSDFDKFQAHTAHYTIPLPWRNVLVFFGGYSSVEAPSLENKAFRSSGDSAQVSGRYVIPFGLASTFSQEITFGVDWKRTNNTLLEGGTAFGRQNVNIFQLMAGYQLSKRFSWVSNEFEVELFVSPGQILPKMNNNRFAELRPGATNTYSYIRSRFEQVYYLPKKWTILTRIEGQLASSKLLPSEEFGLGGYYTVRGYRERIVNADNAIFVSVQPQLPPLHLRRLKDDSLLFFVFTDFGVGGNQLPDKGVTGTSTLWSIGPGVHYSLGDNISLRGDWGYQLSKFPKDPNRNRFNFRAILSY